MKRAVCLVSGGLDSAVAVAIAKAEGYDLYFLTVDYGQVTSTKELNCAEKLAEFYQIKELQIIKLDWLRRIGGSALLDPNVKLTPENEALEYVPFRNTVLLSIGVAWAEVLRAGAVFIGSTGGDRICPDNSPDYIEAMQQVIRLGTKLKTDIALRAPLLQGTKKEAVMRGFELKVPFELTWSCQNCEDVACGECSNCRARLQAFAANGLQDPVPYP